MMVDVAVIGGGISGLATAFDLVARGYGVVVLERQVRAGGSAISEPAGGFLMEHGPSSINGTSAAGREWSSRLGLDRERVALGPAVRQRYLTKASTLSAIPIHPLGFATSKYLSFSARLRLFAEAMVPRRPALSDETVAAFCRRRFGAEFADRVIDPLVGGMFAGMPARLSMAATFPKLVEMERRYGSVIVGAVRSRFGGGRMPGRQLFSWRRGVGALPRALATRLGPAVRLGIAARRISRHARGFRVDAGASGAFDARAVVLATPSHVAATLLESLDPAAAAAGGRIAAPPLAVVFLGYPRACVDHPLDGIGYLTATSEGRALNGALFCSTAFPGRAPPDHVALSAYVGGARAPDLARLPAPDLVEVARAEFAELLGTRGHPVVVRVRHWPRGLPQYNVGHGELLRVIVGAEDRWPGLFVTGNYFAGVSVTACLQEAVRAAARAQAFLSRSDRTGDNLAVVFGRLGAYRALT